MRTAVVGTESLPFAFSDDLQMFIRAYMNNIHCLLFLKQHACQFL
jgi:hypothetical protein